MSESNRKKVLRELVAFNVENLEDEQVSVIVKKHVTELSELYRKKYDDISARIIERELREGADSNLHSSNSRKVVITGVREETDEEFDQRMGIDRSNSWDTKYAIAANCSAEEARQEMEKMVEQDFLMTPERWIQFKLDKVKEVLNVDEEK